MPGGLPYGPYRRATARGPRLLGDDDPASRGASAVRRAHRHGGWGDRAQLVDAAAVAALFNIITRYADALGFAIPTAAEFDKSALMLLKRGYG